MVQEGLGRKPWGNRVPNPPGMPRSRPSQQSRSTPKTTLILDVHVELADEAVLLTGDTIGETYLDQEQILGDCTIQTGPTPFTLAFGFLSERADFARAVGPGRDLQWVGPSPEAIEQMGDKMTARITMRAAGVPVIPWRRN